MIKDRLLKLILLTLIFLVSYDIYLHDYKRNNIKNRFKKNTANVKTLHESMKNCSVINSYHNQHKVRYDDITYPYYIPLIHKKDFNFKCLNERTKNETTKVFYLATKYFEYPDYKFDFGKKKQFESIKCPVTNCEITNDFNRYNSSDIAVFHTHNLYQVNRTYYEWLIQNRPQQQRWALVEYETTITHPIKKLYYSKFENMFNFTWSYNIETSYLSSIYQINSNFVWELNKTFKNNYDYHKEKSKFAAALISNCDAASARIDYLNKLRKYVNVDIYGYNVKCSNMKCPAKGDCRDFISKQYKFFFVIENSFCNGYITEKFFKILNYNIVPVVGGLGDYSKYAPKSAYINLLDFETVKDLASYLIYLDENPRTYNKYFQWRANLKRSFYQYSKTYPKSGQILTYYDFCEMCIKLHLEKYTGIYKNTIKSLDFLLDRKQNCKRPRFRNDTFFLDSYS